MYTRSQLYTHLEDFHEHSEGNIVVLLETLRLEAVRIADSEVLVIAAIHQHIIYIEMFVSFKNLNVYNKIYPFTDAYDVCTCMYEY